MSELPAINTSELRAQSITDGAGLRVIFAGCADSTAMQELDALLRRVHEESVARKVPEVTIDFRALEFMNSSCFKAFVSWISRIQELDAGAQYRICFLSDDAKHWQRRSLGALSCFAADLISVEA
jgi:anti-anti-sigma regulatory factor